MGGENGNHNLIWHLQWDFDGWRTKKNRIENWLCSVKIRCWEITSVFQQTVFMDFTYFSLVSQLFLLSEVITALCKHISRLFTLIFSGLPIALLCVSQYFFQNICWQFQLFAYFFCYLFTLSAMCICLLFQLFNDVFLYSWLGKYLFRWFLKLQTGIHFSYL